MCGEESHLKERDCAVNWVPKKGEYAMKNFTKN